MRALARCVLALSLVLTALLLVPSTASAGWFGRAFGGTDYFRKEAIRNGVPPQVAATRARQLGTMWRTLDGRHCGDAGLARDVWMRTGNLQQSMHAGGWQRLGPNE